MNQNIADLLASHQFWRVEELSTRRFLPETYQKMLDKWAAEVGTITQVGQSFEGRPIRLVTVGSGSTKVLLWSQMHGDEPTATMAIADILNYFRLDAKDETARTILGSLQLLFLPILNPDGAARFQRRTAQGIDMNRDARALQTPEARILKNLQQEHKPTFGFNLHDQELSTVGQSKELSAIALLAPAFDDTKSDNLVRVRAKHVAAAFAETMNSLVPGKVARYDDAHEPRAFGDTMQRWGTSTVLVESGHVVDDPEKESIRRLNAVGILASLNSIATGEFAKSDVSTYESLPLNSKNAYDLIIRGVRIQHKNGVATKADLGISYQVDTHTEDTPRLVDLGDLGTFVGLREIDGKGKVIPQDSLTVSGPFEWESSK